MSLSGSTVVVLAYPGYQEVEFWYPVFRAREEGAHVVIVSADDACESFLGYPVVGDEAAVDVSGADVAVLVAPGTVRGDDTASPAQRDLIRRVHAAGGRLYASGSGADLIRGVTGEEPAGSVEGPDSVGELFRALMADSAA